MRDRAAKLEKVSRKIKKKDSKSSKMEIEQEEVKEPKIKKEISQQVKPELFKDFKQNFDKTKQTFLSKKGKLSHGQKSRLIRKEKVLKKKYFNEFLKQKSYKNPDSTINLAEFSEALEVVASKKKKHIPRDKTQSEKHLIDVQKQEIMNTRAIMSDPRFQKNPLNIMRTHLINEARRKDLK